MIYSLRHCVRGERQWRSGRGGVGLGVQNEGGGGTCKVWKMMALAHPRCCCCCCCCGAAAAAAAAAAAGGLLRLCRRRCRCRAVGLGCAARGAHCKGLAAAAGALGIGVDENKLRPVCEVWGWVEESRLGGARGRRFVRTSRAEKQSDPARQHAHKHERPLPPTTTTHTHTRPAQVHHMSRCTHLSRSCTQSILVPSTCIRAPGSTSTLTPPCCTSSSQRPLSSA